MRVRAVDIALEIFDTWPEGREVVKARFENSETKEVQDCLVHGDTIFTRRDCYWMSQAPLAEIVEVMDKNDSLRTILEYFIMYLKVEFGKRNKPL